MAKIPATWDCGPDADEYAGDRGEARQAVRRGDEEYDYSGGSRWSRGPEHYSGYAAMEGWKEQW
jgi:hypothetical protein